MSRRLKAPPESRTNPHASSTQQDLVDKSGKCLGTIPDGAAQGSLAPTVYLRRGRDNPTPIPEDLEAAATE
jgi:hypothetical protein